jgi:hypothetical protein
MCVSRYPIRPSRSSPRPGFLDLDLMNAARINLFKSATDTIILFCCMMMSRVRTYMVPYWVQRICCSLFLLFIEKKMSEPVGHRIALGDILLSVSHCAYAVSVIVVRSCKYQGLVVTCSLNLPLSQKFLL